MDKYKVGEWAYYPQGDVIVRILRVNPNHSPTLYECIKKNGIEVAIYEDQLMPYLSYIIGFYRPIGY